MAKLVMPPKTRRNKATKALKENISVSSTNKLKESGKVIKPPRKALADKTNSASDDNASVLVIEKQPTKGITIKKLQGKSELIVERSRRVRRLPHRYKENNVLKNLSNSSLKQDSLELHKASPVKNTDNPLKKTPVVILSPLKTPIQILDNSLIKKRPKRICKLPNKFNDHSISPNKFIPVQPINASTPLANKTKNVNKEYPQKTSNVKNTELSQKVSDKNVLKQKTLNDFFNKENTSDSNNNAKQKRRKPQNSPKKSPIKPKSKQTGQKILSKNTSIRILDDNKKTLKRDSSKVDIYEFTYDPEEEPPPAKKKKKKTVSKKPTKQKITIKSNYDKNLAKALAALKNTVSSKPCLEPSVQEENAKAITNSIKPIFDNNKDISIESNINLNKDESVVNERNYKSVRIDDIAMDMQPDNDDSIDYSPINSPRCPQTSIEPIDNQNKNKPNDDPLNLRDDISFFDEQPVASSSMNVSVRHPLASPWRVEFGNLPIKWQVNTYVKPNMTPAVESSFINFNDTKKKHVYTNMVAEANDSLPQVVESPTNLKQTSIMSFIKEVIEKSANKKKKSKLTPVKTNSLFEDLSNTSIVEHTRTKQPLSNNNPKVNNLTPIKDTTISTNNSSNMSNETENSDVQMNVAENATPKDKKKKKKDKDVTYFGFDESEDQENISPKKKNNKARSLRSRTKGILQELNVQNGPTRAIIPVAVKSKPIHSSEVINKLFDGMKSATEPPVFPEVAVNSDTQVTNVPEPAVPENLENEDSESVHLFEDIEFIHHHKRSRKSYSKPKRVVFNKTSAVHNDSDPLSDVDRASSDEDLDDLSFKLPTVKPTKVTKKKKTNKQKLSKKEEKEVEAWAAGFSSMCEDIDKFDLVVE